MKDLNSYCGLDCEKCDAYIATIKNDDELRKKTAELWSKYNGVEINPSDINCLGCKQDGIKTPFCAYMCEIRKCAIESKFPHCGQCTKLKDCSKIKMIIDNNPKALANLESK